MKKSYWIILIICIVFLIFEPGCKKKNGFNGNILVITLDTTRADHISSYGYGKKTTPNIDRLASNGIRFSNCYSAVPLTLPAHTTIFTGEYPPVHGIRNNGKYKLSDRTKTLAEVMKEKGYKTFGVVSSFVLHSKFGINKGFDVFDDSLDSHVTDTTYNSQIDASKVYEKFSSWFRDNRDKKFFAWVHFYDPHTPYVPHTEVKVKKDDKKDLIRLYDGELSYMDLYIGKIIDLLKKSGVLKNTLVAIIGDHGEAFGEHLEFASHMVFCYEANLKVPFIIFNKKMFKESRKIDEFVSIVDFMPTILSITGVDEQRVHNGIDLMPFVNDKKPDKRDLYFESMYGREELKWAPLTGIISENMKFISLPKAELYDLSKDPMEKNNLFIKKTMLSRKLDDRLKKKLLSFSGRSAGSKISLGKKDLEKLKALGYISSIGSGSSKNTDPKDGIKLNVKLKEIARKFDRSDLNEIEQELIDIKKSDLGNGNFIVYDFLYRIYKKKREPKKMMEILRSAIEKVPNSIPFRINYALNLIDLGRIDEAISECNKIIKIDPNFTRAYKTVAELYKMKGETDRSLENFRKAVSLEPKNVSLNIAFAEYLISKKMFRDALSIYNSLVDIDEVKTNSVLIQKIALFHTKYGSMEKASELFSILEANSPKGKYFFLHSLILSKLGDVRGALKKMRTALEKYGSGLTSKEQKLAENQIKKLSQMLKNGY